MGAGGSESLQTDHSLPEQPRAARPELSVPRSEVAPEAGAWALGDEARARSLVATGTVLWTADPDGQFTRPQAAWETYTGQAWPDQRGAGWVNALHADDREAWRRAWSRTPEAPPRLEVESRVWHAGHSSYRRCLLRAAPVPGPDGRVREWIGTLTDLEDQRAADERRRLADRLETVGRLAGGVAHEANNQMMVVLTAAELVRRCLREGEGHEELAYISVAAQRTATITHQLLAYSRRQILHARIVDLNDVVRALEPALREALGEALGEPLGEAVWLVVRPAPRPVMVEIDPAQFRHVLLNLATNARRAMDQGGALTIETTEVAVDSTAPAADHRAVMPPGRYAMLVVTDTGRGMDAETLRHAFEPFFTTRDIGEGPGLGLSAAYGIVKQSGGFIGVESEPGAGATFRICLPLAGPRAAAATTSTATAGEATRDVILLAEDDELVRIMLGRVLRDAGYAIVEAGDGEEALRLAAAAVVPPRLVVADVMMPRVNGQRLWHELHARWPDLPLLFVSGHATVDSVSQELIERGHELLQKPVAPELLLEKVRSLLAARTD